MKTVFTLVLFALLNSATAQTNIFPSTGSAGIGTVVPNASSALEIKSTTQGLLIPRMSKAKRDAIVSPVNGLLIYQTNSTAGFYYYDDTQWLPVSPASANNKLSNLSAPTAVNVDLFPDSNAQRAIGSATHSWKKLYLNGAIFQFGNRVLLCDKTMNNTFVGSQAGTLNVDGNSNTATGISALYSNVSGGFNTANGTYALYSNIGDDNTATGYQALYSNTYGSYNTAIGLGALYSNNVGSYNTATGYYALNANTIGTYNTANGYQALQKNTEGSYNTAGGYGSLNSNSASYNTGYGSYSLYSTTSGQNNTALGYLSIVNNTTGSNNTAFGASALYSVTGDNNTGIGASSDVAAGLSNCTAIGYGAYVATANQVIVGNGSVTSIGGLVGWSNFSDGRFKTNVKENVPGLIFINKLKPITYNLEIKKINELHGIKDTGQYSQKADPKAEKIIRTGFIAQDVEKAAQQISYDFDGVHHPDNSKDNYSLVYADFVPSLVKAVQELSSENSDLKQQNSGQQQQIDQLKNIVEQLAKKNGINIDFSSSSARLEQNIPNPSKQSTTINYYVPKNANTAMLKITSLSGETLKTATLAAGGNGTYTLQTSTLHSGTYMYSLYVDGKLIDTKKLEIIK